MYKAIMKSHLSNEYKQSTIIGQGATSLVIDKGEDVEILTRDFIKVDLLRDSGYARDCRIVDNIKPNDRSPGYNDYDVYSLKMKKLQKYTFSSESRKEASKCFRAFKKIEEEIRHNLGYIQSGNLYRYNDAILENILETEEKDLEPLRVMADYISDNWPADSYIFDMGPRNMLWDQDKQQIFINDPVVPLDLYECMRPDSHKYIMRRHYDALREETKRTCNKEKQNNMNMAI